MAYQDEPLRYHGRRSLDELVGALNADNAAVARVHQELALLHWDRVVALILTATNGTFDRRKVADRLRGGD